MRRGRLCGYPESWGVCTEIDACCPEQINFDKGYVQNLWFKCFTSGSTINEQNGIYNVD